MRITLNGAARDVEPGTTIAALVAALGLESRLVAVERNREVVTRSLHATTEVAEGDEIEVVHFVGGG